EETLAAIWAGLLGVERVGIRDDFFELGGDSILSIQIVARAREAGLHLSLKQLFEHPTVAELAARAGTAAPLEPAEQGLVVGPVPPTPIQRWFFEQDLPSPDHFNQAMLLVPAPGLHPAWVEGAVTHLQAHHDALRTRFARGEDGWRQEVMADAPAAFTRVDLGRVPEEEQVRAIEAEAQAAQGSLD